MLCDLVNWPRREPEPNNDRHQEKIIGFENKSGWSSLGRTSVHNHRIHDRRRRAKQSLNLKNDRI